MENKISKAIEALKCGIAEINGPSTYDSRFTTVVAMKEALAELQSTPPQEQQQGLSEKKVKEILDKAIQEHYNHTLGAITFNRIVPQAVKEICQLSARCESNKADIEEIISIYDNWVHSRNSDTFPEVLRELFKDGFSAPTSEEREREILIAFVKDTNEYQRLGAGNTSLIIQVEAYLDRKASKQSNK